MSDRRGDMANPSYLSVRYIVNRYIVMRHIYTGQSECQGVSCQTAAAITRDRQFGRYNPGDDVDRTVE